jgi:hypothetical protein
MSMNNKNTEKIREVLASLTSGLTTAEQVTFETYSWAV